MEPNFRARKSLVDGLDVSEKPRYTVSEVAKFFFAKSAHWIRWQEKPPGPKTKGGGGLLTEEGQTVVEHRTEGGARYYTLRDVELMAHALCRNGAIDALHLKNVLRLVFIEAHVWGYLPREDE